MKYLLLIFLLSLHLSLSAQDSLTRQQQPVDSLSFSDSLSLQDTGVFAIPLNADSLQAVNARQSISQIQVSLREHPYYNFFGTPVSLPMAERKKVSDDLLFYAILGIFAFFALIRVIFPRYLQNMFSLFFRGNFRAQQTREQMLQTPQASLLINILFLFSAGLYLNFLAASFGFSLTENFWMMYLYALGFLGAIYLGKFLFLKFFGWIFNMSKATDSYIFIVFLTNKIIGILLLPVLLMLAFPYSGLYELVLSGSLILIILLFLYRFFISYAAVRREIKVKRLHFFAYLCAFEIAPLLLIYKVLLNLTVSIT